MQKRIFSIVLIVLASIFGIIFLPHLVLAQTPAPQALNATVSPVFFDLTTTPGGVIKNKVRIMNNLSQPVALKVEVKKIAPGSNSSVSIQDMKDTDTLKNWITFDKTSFVAQPKEWVEVPFTLTVPPDASYGYYMAISFTQDNSVNISQGAKVSGSVAVPILLTVKKEGAKAVAKIDSFSATPVLNEYLPVTFTTKVSNMGNIHVKPRGSIFIRGTQQKDIAILDVNAPDAVSILPGGSRVFTTEWNDGFIVREPVVEDGKVKTDSKGNPVTHLKINWNKLTDFRMGRYTATLVLAYDTGTRDETMQQTASFWVIPYTPIIVIVVILLLIILVIRFILRSYIKRELSRSKK